MKITRLWGSGVIPWEYTGPLNARFLHSRKSVLPSISRTKRDYEYNIVNGNTQYEHNLMSRTSQAGIRGFVLHVPA